MNQAMGNFLIVKILYSAAALQGVLLAVLLFNTKINQPANRILSVLVFLLSFHLILVGFDNRDFFMAFPHLSRISWIIGSLYWPLIFLVIQYLTRTQFTQQWKNVLLFLPFIFFLVQMIPYYMLSAEVKRTFITDFEKSSQEDFGWLNQTMSVLHIIFQGLCLLYYYHVEKRMKDEYSDIESVRIKWLENFLLLMFMVTILAVVSFFGRTFNWSVLSHFYNFHFIGVALMFYWLSYNALTRPVLFGISQDLNTDKKESSEVTDSIEKYTKSGLDTDKSQGVFDTIRNTIASEKLYCKNNLTLSDISERTGIPRHHISQSISVHFDGNFFDLINDFRIKEFKRLAHDPAKRNLSLLGLAQEAGFNSKASFYSIFKKRTGMTPSNYLEMESNA
jgi:AraC-like DNA-binding protein